MLDVKLRTFIKKEESYYFLTRSPLSNTTLVEKEVFNYDNFSISKLFNMSIEVGYKFNFNGKDVTYGQNFIDFCDIEDNSESESTSVIYKDSNLYILAKTAKKHILVIGA